MNDCSNTTADIARNSAVEPPRTALLVLGMHRSGTSALTRVLSLLGASLPKNLLKASPSNETGHWEPDRLIALHDRMLAEVGSSWDDWRKLDISASLEPVRLAQYKSEIRRLLAEEFADAPLIALKEPRICRFAPLYIDLLAEQGYACLSVLPLRNPLAVIASLARRNSMSEGFAALLWLRHVLDAEAATRSKPRVVVTYEALLADWRGQMRALHDRLPFQHQRSLDDASADVADFLSDKHQHFAATRRDLHLRGDIAAWIKDAYDALLRLEHVPDDPEAYGRLDRIKTEFDAASPIFGAAMFPELAARESGLRDVLSQLEDQSLATRTTLALCEADLAVARRELSARDEATTNLQATLAADAQAMTVLQAQNEDLERALGRIQSESANHKRAIASSRETITELRDSLRTAKETAESYATCLEQQNQTLDLILNSASWRATAPLRRAKHLAKLATRTGQRVVTARRQLGTWRQLIRHANSAIAQRGLLNTLAHAANSPAPLSAESLQAMRLNAYRVDIAGRLNDYPEHSTADGPKISVLMPVYKAPTVFLERAVRSVIRQSYPNWELCIVDDFSSSPAIEACLRSLAREDQRIRVEFAPENGGISKATNRALTLATGDYCCLLDHDDMLTSDALSCISDVIRRSPAIDLIYSDECKIDEDDHPDELFFKPDWDPMLLQNCMYTGHLSTYRTSLLRSLGGFRSQFDLSQDYDLILRATEATKNIAHIPRVLYGWRKIATSAASGGKPEARLTNIAALQEASDRRGYHAKAVALPTANRLVHERAGFDQLVSIIIPSDNISHIRAAIASIREKTKYRRHEIIVVTNSRIIEELRRGETADPTAKFAAFDEAFNFSAKCNTGVRASTGDILVFFNDDVRVVSDDWIESILDCLRVEGVGVCGPKLLYENDTIQHAGMVTGVRGLVGTAFHSYPANTTHYFNLAQSIRQVSLICGACLAIKRSVFEAIGGYDADKFPISHSDVDLCLKVLSLGQSCVYTPHATLYHIGHASLSAVEKRPTSTQARRKDKADIELLRKWSDRLSRDPFWTGPMRDLLYVDSPETFEIHPPAVSPLSTTSGSRHILLVFHDLTNSGAPRALYEVAQHLVEAGHFVVAASPTSGEYLEKLNQLGIVVIVDALLLEQHHTVKQFASNFDAVIANTIVSWPLVNQCAGAVDTYWYIHETGLIDEFAQRHAGVAKAFDLAKQVWVTGHHGKASVRRYRPNARVMEIGLPSQDTDEADETSDPSDSIKILTIGSIEPRKGQDLAILALKRLPVQLRHRVELHLIGRTLDQHFEREVRKLAAGERGVHFHGEISPENVLTEISGCHVMLLASRDDPMPLVALDAIARGRVVVCGPAVGLYDYLTDEQNGFLADSSSPDDLAAALARALEQEHRWQDIGRSAQTLFHGTFSTDAFKRRLFANLGLPISKWNERSAPVTDGQPESNLSQADA
jgi:GT2 family glycosyltransferase